MFNSFNLLDLATAYNIIVELRGLFLLFFIDKYTNVEKERDSPTGILLIVLSI